MWVLGNFVLFAALLGCHAIDLSQDEGWVEAINQMQAETTKLATLVKDLKNEKEEMKMEITAIKTENEAMKMETKAMKMDNDAMKMEFDRLRNSTLAAVTPMCFNAVKTTNQDVVPGDTIIFNQEIIDTHDTYNPTYGIYVIPQTGIWEVIVTLFKPAISTYNDNMSDLYVDDTSLSRLHLLTVSNEHDYVTSTIIRVFNAGDALRVQALKTVSCYGTSVQKSSQFSAKFLGVYP